MKLAIIGDEISQDLSAVLQTMTEMGFVGLELRSVWGTPPHLLSDAQVARIDRECKLAGIQIIGIDSPVGKKSIELTIDQIDEERDRLHRAIDIAVTLGAEFVRCFTFYRNELPQPDRAAEIFARIIDGVDFRDRRILIETGMRTNTPTIPLLLEFLTALGRNDLGILWDPGNSLYSGMEMQPFPKEWEVGRHKIEHVHVKDPDGSREYVRLGDGDIGWQSVVDRLASDGYQGWLSLETHWRTERILSQAARDEPWGESFSDGGGEASSECMRIMAEMVEHATRSSS